MAEWSKEKADSASINGGRAFTTDDNLTVTELNSMVNNSFYAVDFAEAMADAPDISEIDGTGTPSVSFVDNGKFKKLKFSNLKGSKGDVGEKGEKGDKGDTGDTVPNTLTIGSVSSGDAASATITGTAPNQVLNLVLPKGDKGDTGDKGESGDSSTPTVFELELEILKTTDTFATNFTNNGQIFTSTNFKYERFKYQKLNTDVYNSIFEQAESHKICFVTINGSTYMGETYLPQNKVSFNIYIYREGYAVTFSRGNVYIYQYSNSSTTSSITINSIEFR